MMQAESWLLLVVGLIHAGRVYFGLSLGNVGLIHAVLCSKSFDLLIMHEIMIPKIYCKVVGDYTWSQFITVTNVPLSRLKSCVIV
jgi:hypothetical protein